MYGFVVNMAQELELLIIIVAEVARGRRSVAHGVLHPCRPPDEAKKSDGEQRHDRVHFHRRVMFDEFHLNNVGEDKLKGKLAKGRREECQEGLVQTAVEKNDRNW